MKKIISVLAVLAVLALSIAVPVFAQTEELPKGLEDKGPLTKITFIHYKKNFVKPPQAGGGAAACYGYLSKGVFWKTLPQSIVVNPTNSGMDANSVLSAIGISAQTWESDSGLNLFGNAILDYTADALNDDADGVNEVSFGNYPDANVIAVTSVWGYFGGPVQTRQIVDFDILFDTDFTWGNADIDQTVMDLQNIATHEIGHGWGMGDIYSGSCSAVTMYGYSTNGEIIKRTLEPADIKGITSLYR